MCDWGNNHSLIYGEKKLSKFGHFIGEDAIDMLSIKVLKGDRNP